MITGTSRASRVARHHGACAHCPRLPRHHAHMREHERYDRTQNLRSRPPRRIAPASRPIVRQCRRQMCVKSNRILPPGRRPLPRGARTGFARRAPDGEACAPTPARGALDRVAEGRRCPKARAAQHHRARAQTAASRSNTTLNGSPPSRALARPHQESGWATRSRRARSRGRGRARRRARTATGRRRAASPSSAARAASARRASALAGTRAASASSARARRRLASKPPPVPTRRAHREDGGDDLFCHCSQIRDGAPAASMLARRLDRPPLRRTGPKRTADSPRNAAAPGRALTILRETPSLRAAL